MSSLKLNIGASRTKLDGFVNIDIVPGCDLQCDLNQEKLPFEDGSVDCVFSYHTIEHLENYLWALGEIWRVLRHEGHFLLQVPYVTLTEYNLVNPYHKQHFNEFSFDFFDISKLKGSAGEAGGILFTKGWHRFHYMPEFQATPEPMLTFYRRHMFNVVRAIDFGLYAVKPPETRFATPDDAAKKLREEFDGYLTSRVRAPWDTRPRPKRRRLPG